MARRIAAFFLVLAAAFSLCGCGSVFDAEYVVETSFEPVLPVLETGPDNTAVESPGEIKQVLLDMVTDGRSSHRMVFSPSYPGDVNNDMASAVWQARTQDALCAYCVENISYDVFRIVNHYEAVVSVLYGKAAEDRESIVLLPYAADAGDVLREAMACGQEALVLLIDRSSYSDEEMVEFARQIYREDPAIAPCEPEIHVNMIIGSDTQRLYDFSFSYPPSAKEFAERQAALSSLSFFDDEDCASLSEAQRALLACQTLLDCCRYTADAEKDSLYDALVGGEANSRGMACAYTALCRRLGLSCRMIVGQRHWEDHVWNLVEIDGMYYHVDTAACAVLGPESAFLLNDESAWGTYRWDYFAYPHSDGTLRYEEIPSWQTQP